MRQSVLNICIFSVMLIGVGSIIFSGNPVIEVQRQMSAYAQPMNNTTTEVISTTKNTHNTTLPGQTIVHRGIISSEEPVHLVLKPGEEQRSVEILPHRPDEATYTGILTFTASKPVEVGFGHRLHIDNSTSSQLDAETFGDFHKRHHVKSQLISVPSVIVPDYGTAPPYFSASIPFVGSSVFLRNINGEQFIAVYEVVAEVVQPQAHVVDIESAAGGTNMTMTTLSTTNQTGGQS